MYPTLIDRHSRRRLDQALDVFRVVMVHGPRQPGKTTLARLVFRAGVLLHTGPQSLTVGDRLHLCPISMLWSTPH